MLDNLRKPEKQRFSLRRETVIPLESHFRIAKQNRKLALLRYKLGVRDESELLRRIGEEKQLLFPHI